jgi:ferredoxin
MPNLCTIHFPNTSYPAIALDCEQNLSEHLTVQNSPILFGCRTGICGTCLVKVTGSISPAQADEQELLDAIAPAIPNARLACQICLTADLWLERLT